MKNKIKLSIFSLIIVLTFSNTSLANVKNYTKEELNNAISYLREHRDELNITGYSILKDNSGLKVMADKWTIEKEELIKDVTGIENIKFILDYGVDDGYDGIKIRLINKETETASYYKGDSILLIDNRIFVPARNIFESIGYEILWDNNKNTVTATNKNSEIILTIGENNVIYKKFNGDNKIINIDTPVSIINNSTYIPLRLIPEVTDYALYWNEELKIVFIE